MPDLPTGTVTFLFTDIEGSTERWEHDREAMQTAVERYLTILRETADGPWRRALQDGGGWGPGRIPDSLGGRCRCARCATLAIDGAVVGDRPPVMVRMAVDTAAASHASGDSLHLGSIAWPVSSLSPTVVRSCSLSRPKIWPAFAARTAHSRGVRRSANPDKSSTTRSAPAARRAAAGRYPFPTPIGIAPAARAERTSYSVSPT